MSRYLQVVVPQEAQPLPSADEAWHQALLELLAAGREVGAQASAGAGGGGTLELLHRQVVQVNPLRPIIANPDRKLNYRFMAAEALWILRGDDRVEPLAKHVPLMRKFSDDGVHLRGAYGPPVREQLPYVREKLRRDPLSRQAVLTIWRPSPPESNDIPCTIAMSFLLRAGQLYQHVFMRSSDLWLGIPYDVFSFSLIGLKLAAQLDVKPAGLTITAASSHLYRRDQAKAEALLARYSDALLDHGEVPYLEAPPLDEVGGRWWPRLEGWLEDLEAGLTALTPRRHA